MTSCNLQEYINYRTPPPIPRISISPNDDIARNRLTYDTLKRSSNLEDILDAIEFADYFNDSIYLFQTLENANKVEYLIFDLEYYTTPGERAFSKIMDGEKYVKSDQDRISLCLKLLKDLKFYHLHDLAGFHIAKLVDSRLGFKDFFDTYLSTLSDYEIGYILVRMNQNCEDDFTEGFTLNKEQEDQAIEYIKNERCSNSIKTYLLDYLYSVNSASDRGDLLFNKVKNLKLDLPILKYNDLLYQDYIKTKPLFERLDSIHTWMEMDKNISNIEVLLNYDSPLMFFQILSFNPSTVLESKTLCRRKIKTIKKLVFDAEPESFFSTYKLILRNELDLKDSYDIRFIKETYPRRKFERLRNKLIIK